MAQTQNVAFNSARNGGGVGGEILSGLMHRETNPSVM